MYLYIYIYMHVWLNSKDPFCLYNLINILYTFPMSNIEKVNVKTWLKTELSLYNIAIFALYSLRNRNAHSIDGLIF